MDTQEALVSNFYYYCFKCCWNSEKSEFCVNWSNRKKLPAEGRTGVWILNNGHQEKAYCTLLSPSSQSQSSKWCSPLSTVKVVFLFNLQVFLFSKATTAFQGTFFLPCTWPACSVKTTRLQSSGLPPVADTSAFSLAGAQPRKHLQGQLLSDTFSASDGLAESSLLGSPPPDGGREAQERLDLSPGHGGAPMTWSFCLKNSCLVFCSFFVK